MANGYWLPKVTVMKDKGWETVQSAQRCPGTFPHTEDEFVILWIALSYIG